MNLGKESEKVEFKRSTSELDNALCDMAAILNKHGSGTLYFGVDDSGEVVGQEIGKETLRDIARRVGERIRPEVYPEIELDQAEGKNYIIVKFSGSFVPYSCGGRYYMRVADTSRELTPFELRRFLLRTDISLWEALPSDEGLEDVDEKTLEHFYRNAVGKRLPGDIPFDKKALLEHLGLLFGGEKLTNAGKYLFSKNKPITFRMAVFATREKLNFLDINRAEGNIYSLIREGEDYIMRHVDWRAKITDSTRIETPEVPRLAVKEIVVNCLAHADYLSESSPEIDIFKDRISISNPGRFPDGYIPEDFVTKDIRPMQRNQKICDILFLSSDIENYGTGLKRVYELCEKQKVAVAYEKEKDGFCFMFLRGKRKGKGQKADGSSLTPVEKTVVKEISKNPDITLEILAYLSCKSVRQIQRVVNSLREERILYRVGSKKTGHWVVNL